jgi:dolichol-phosphate mannosyltransferase
MKPKISIVLPTYNEADNLNNIVTDIFRMLPDAQVVIVDDNSPDGTGKSADKLAKKHNIKVVHRPMKMGLGPAIAEGFRSADGEIIGVMDADGSHPADLILKLVRPLIDGVADIVIGSRKVKGGGVENWGMHRRFISWGATIMAKPIARVSDPLSGFFVLKKELVFDKNFKTKGYKILLEILAKQRHARVMEVPYIFNERAQGYSKLGAKENFNYLIDLSRLYLR